MHQLQEADQLSRTERGTAVRQLTKRYSGYKSLIDEITETTKFNSLTDAEKIEQINMLLKEHEQEQDDKDKNKIELFEKSLESIAKDKDYFNILEKTYRKLKNRVSGIINELDFNKENSNKNLLTAIEYYKNGKFQGEKDPPTKFLTKIEQDALVDEKGNFREALYNVLLYFHVADAIKSGKLNLKYSYRFLAIQDYLIDEETWHLEREDLLELTGLKSFADHNITIDNLKEKLNDKYIAVNGRYRKDMNPYLSIIENKNNHVHVTTPPLEEKGCAATLPLFLFLEMNTNY